MPSLFVCDLILLTTILRNSFNTIDKLLNATRASPQRLLCHRDRNSRARSSPSSTGITPIHEMLGNAQVAAGRAVRVRSRFSYLTSIFHVLNKPWSRVSFLPSPPGTCLHIYRAEGSAFALLLSRNTSSFANSLSRNSATKRYS